MTDTNDYRFFATCPRPFEELLAEELQTMGIETVSAQRGGVAFDGEIEDAYRACLWSRIANRVLYVLHRFKASDSDQIYDAVRTVDWGTHIKPRGTLAVDAVVVHAGGLNSQYLAQRVKDAVVDQFMDFEGIRPSVDLGQPDLRINLYLRKADAQLALDLSGDSLHKRGYRQEGVAAPLKENLAAGLLALARWPEAHLEHKAFVDPMCGSATFPIEAALMAADVAPGLLRDYFGFKGWLGHQPKIWERLLEEAQERDRREESAPMPIVGWDQDKRAIASGWQNVRAAGLVSWIHLERRGPAQWEAPDEEGVLVVNPPYGERLGQPDQLVPLYLTIGDVLKGQFGGWTAWILSGNRELDGAVGLRPKRKHVVWNGPIECRFLELPIRARKKKIRPIREDLQEAAEQFRNRLEKMERHLGKWARRQGITCYRLYDADLPDFNLAIDLYEDQVHVQEYQAPKHIESSLARARVQAAMTIIREVLEVPLDEIHLKVRRRQAGNSQYGRLRQFDELIEVQEGGHKFYVNLRDYLDTGLFLDSRPVRAHIEELAKGKRFLNLFAYTGTATVYAVAGGAKSSTTVDLSRTYLDWARQNLELNGIQSKDHQLVRDDCLRWIKKQRRMWDLIYLDPPTFSNSKSMNKSFDVNRDHGWLIGQCMRRLSDDGTLIFCTNARSFKLDTDELDRFECYDLSPQMLDEDFQRNPNIHSVWRITH